MTILDGQNELQKDSELGLFSYSDIANIINHETNTETEFTKYVDTGRLCDSITITANHLSQKSLHPLLRGIEEKCLEERLLELKQDIAETPMLQIDFSDRLTSNSCAYDSLLTTYLQESNLEKAHQILIPRENIQAVTVLVGKESESMFRPRVVLQIFTGLETPKLAIKDGETVKEPGQARWFDFPLGLSRISTLGLPIKQ